MKSALPLWRVAALSVSTGSSPILRPMSVSRPVLLVTLGTPPLDRVLLVTLPVLLVLS